MKEKFKGIDCEQLEFPFMPPRIVQYYCVSCDNSERLEKLNGLYHYICEKCDSIMTEEKPTKKGRRVKK